MNDLSIPPYFTIAACELTTQVSTSSGAGGQHVNKTSTKVTLRWNIGTSTSIKENQRQRLLDKLANRINKKKEIVVHCDQTRSQYKNHQIVREKLLSILQQALHKPKKRKATRPTKGSIERRLKAKKKRAEVKRNRSSFD
ncbi:MAG: aminoacyl-tRNA hydrolase [Deltaproteobacteria bacterium]|nr:aminoacyl-tRNA hydrolase [Deltaproteobacteria bacterium]